MLKKVISIAVLIIIVALFKYNYIKSAIYADDDIRDKAMFRVYLLGSILIPACCTVIYLIAY